MILDILKKRYLFFVFLIFTFTSLLQIVFGSLIAPELTFKMGMDSAIYGSIAMSPVHQIFEKGVWSYAPDYYAQRVLPAVLVHYGLRIFNFTIDQSNIIRGFQLLNFAFGLVSLFFLNKIISLFTKNIKTNVLSMVLFFAGPFMIRWVFYYPVLNDAAILACMLAIFYFYLRGQAAAVFCIGLLSSFVWSFLGLIALCFLAFPEQFRLIKEKHEDHLSNEFLNQFLIYAVCASPVFIFPMFYYISLSKPYMGPVGGLYDVFLGLSITIVSTSFFFWLVLKNGHFEWSEVKKNVSSSLVGFFLAVVLFTLKQIWVSSVSPERTLSNLIPLSYALGGAIRVPGSTFPALFSFFGVGALLIPFMLNQIRSQVFSRGLGYGLVFIGCTFLLYDPEGRHHIPLWVLLLPSIVSFLELKSKQFNFFAYAFIGVITFFVSKVWQMKMDSQQLQDVHMGINFFFMDSKTVFQTFGFFVFLMMILSYWLGSREKTKLTEN